MVLCLCLMVQWAAAQGVLAPPPALSVTPPAMLAFQTNRSGSLAAPEATLPGRPPFQWGPVGLRPHLFYRVLYGDGIPSSPSNRLVTAINEVSPGLLMELGSHWVVDYTPTFRAYSNKAFQDTLDHQALLIGGTTYEDWVLGLNQSYRQTSEPLVQTGTQTTEEMFVTDLTGSYRFNSKLSMDLGVNQTFASADEFTSYRQWMTPDWLNYQFAPRLDAGPGVTLGYMSPDNGPDIFYAELLGRVRWRVAEKMSLQVSAGVDDHHFLAGGAGDLINPVFGAMLEYRPFERTMFSLSGDRMVDASYFANQVTEITTVRAALNQRFLSKLGGSLSGTYSRMDYVSTTGGFAVSRHDDFYAFEARLSWSFVKRGTASVVYQHTENVSSEPGAFSFLSDQVALELGYYY